MNKIGTKLVLLIFYTVGDHCSINWGKSSGVIFKNAFQNALIVKKYLFYYKL